MFNGSIYGNIVEISCVEVSKCSNLIVDYSNGTVSGEMPETIGLKMSGLGNCTDETTLENKAVIHNVKLTAVLAELPFKEFSGTKLAYVFRTADGRIYIIGGSLKPFPVTTVVENFPGDVTVLSGFQLTVTFSSHHGVLKLLQ